MDGIHSESDEEEMIALPRILYSGFVVDAKIEHYSISTVKSGRGLHHRGCGC